MAFFRPDTFYLKLFYLAALAGFFWLQFYEHPLIAFGLALLLLPTRGEFVFFSIVVTLGFSLLAFAELRYETLLPLLYAVLAAAAGVGAWRGQLIMPLAEDSKAYALAARMRPVYLTLAVLCAGLLLFRPLPILAPVSWTFILIFIGRGLPRREAPRAQPVSLGARAATVLLFLFAIAAGLAVIELGTRFLMPGQSLGRSVYTPNPSYTFLLEPGATGTFHVPTGPDSSKPYEVEISSAGIRDREYGPKAPDEYRILMLGDSFVMGHGVDAANSIPKVLEEELQGQLAGKRVSVVNAGIDGGGPLQYLGMWRTRCQQFNPDLVILQVFPSNDFENSLESVGGSFWSYDRNWKNTILYYQLWNIPYYRADSWVREHFYAYQLLRQSTEYRAWIGATLNNVRILPRYELPRLPYCEDRLFSVEVDLAEWYPELEKAFDLTCEYVDTVRREVQESGAAFIAYTQPSMDQTDDEIWRIHTAELSPGVEYERAKSIRRMNEWFTEEGIPNFTLYDGLRPYPADEYWFRYDGHLNEKGYRVAAGIIARYLLENYFPARGIAVASEHCSAWDILSMPVPGGMDG